VRQLLFFTASGLVSVSPQDGHLYWRYPWETHYGCNIATPIVRGDYVFISSGYGKGCALLKILAGGPNGVEAKRVWETNQLRNHFSSSVLQGEHIYGFDDPGLLTCLDFRTGKAAYKERGFKKGSLLAVEGHLLLLGESGNLGIAEANPKEFKVKAQFQASTKTCWTVPVLANGKLYVRDEDKLTCFNLKKP